MANTIIPGLLQDTYDLVQLARETALAQGKASQASKLTPVVDDLKDLVKTSNQPKAVASPAEVFGQSDFQTLLNAAKAVPGSQRSMNITNVAERNQMVRAMTASNMLDVDIARQLGMTREEVRMITSLSAR